MNIYIYVIKNIYFMIYECLLLYISVLVIQDTLYDDIYYKFLKLLYIYILTWYMTTLWWLWCLIHIYISCTCWYMKVYIILLDKPSYWCIYEYIYIIYEFALLKYISLLWYITVFGCFQHYLYLYLSSLVVTYYMAITTSFFIKFNVVLYIYFNWVCYIYICTYAWTYLYFD